MSDAQIAGPSLEEQIATLSQNEVNLYRNLENIRAKQEALSTEKRQTEEHLKVTRAMLDGISMGMRLEQEKAASLTDSQ